MRLQKKIASGECTTLKEAIEVINKEQQDSLNRVIESVEARKSSNWLAEASNLVIKNVSNNNSSSGNINSHKRVEDLEFEKFDAYCHKTHINERNKLHFYAHVCFPWSNYEYSSTYTSKSNKYLNDVTRNQLPPFGDNLIDSFENYVHYNNTFIHFKDFHCLDIYSKELSYFNSNLTKSTSTIEDIINYYKALCYMGAKGNEGSKCAVKIKRNNLSYGNKSLDLLCYIVYNVDTNFVVSSGVLSANLSNRAYLYANTSVKLPESQYSVEYSSNFDVNYFICHINSISGRDEITYKFIYEIKSNKLSEVLDKYNSQTSNSKDIIYVISNDIVGCLYYLQQNHTLELFKQLNDKYKHINLDVTHTPINVQTTKDALKELDDIDD